LGQTAEGEVQRHPIESRPAEHEVEVSELVYLALVIGQSKRIRFQGEPEGQTCMAIFPDSRGARYVIDLGPPTAECLKHRLPADGHDF
jgi:hypothetical protein